MKLVSLLSLAVMLVGSSVNAQVHPGGSILSGPRATSSTSSPAGSSTSTNTGTTYTCCGKQTGCSQNNPSTLSCSIKIINTGTCEAGTVVTDLKVCLAAIDSDYNWSQSGTWNQTHGATWSYNKYYPTACPSTVTSNCTLCCNGKTGNLVNASATGCDNGKALYFVSSAAECVKDKCSGGKCGGHR
jgi:hypothetical protein